jgi:hypothetical protein
MGKITEKNLLDVNQVSRTMYLQTDNESDWESWHIVMIKKHDNACLFLKHLKVFRRSFEVFKEGRILKKIKHLYQI